MITFAVLFIAYTAPQHVGPYYGTVTFFSIVWLGFTAFFTARLRSAVPPAPRVAYVLYALTMLLFAIPLIVGWTYRELGPLLETAELVAVFSLFLATILNLVFLVVFRRIALHRWFGSERRNPIGEIKLVMQAQREVLAENQALLEEFRRKET